MLKEELVKNLKKALTSSQKVKVTSCILPQRNWNSVEKLIRYSFIHKGFLHEVPDSRTTGAGEMLQDVTK